mmetsp:Transcript_2390/g.6168  ORF Transcript_2390/g.6168 Transcript_2390/m.6168 type:complete len:208 (+) Transcript_2390:426-1049(+)
MWAAPCGPIWQPVRLRALKDSPHRPEGEPLAPSSASAATGPRKQPDRSSTPELDTADASDAALAARLPFSFSKRGSCVIVAARRVRTARAWLSSKARERLTGRARERRALPWLEATAAASVTCRTAASSGVNSSPACDRSMSSKGGRPGFASKPPTGTSMPTVILQMLLPCQHSGAEAEAPSICCCCCCCCCWGSVPATTRATASAA